MAARVSAHLTSTLGRHLRATARAVALTLIAVAALYPILWVVSTAFKERSEFVTSPWSVPRSFTAANFTAILEDDALGRYFLNSILITCLAVALLLIVSVPAGYALARLRMRGRRTLLGVFLLSEMIPSSIIAIPILLTYQRLQVDDDQTRLVLAYAVGLMGFSVFILRGFFLTVPEQLREAARMDGYGELQTFLKVMLPLARSPIALVAVFATVVFWNEFYVALVLISDESSRTLPLGLMRFQGQYQTDWPRIAALLVMSAVPTFILYAIFQRRIATGLGAGVSYK